jgi:UDP-2,3-diacylglucosamine pyrophosphatase LpxH
MTRKIFISDLHMCTDAALAATPHPYGWLHAAAAARVERFLRWVGNDGDCDELVLLGDVVDLWVYPHDIEPPTLDNVCTAEVNRPIVSALQDLIHAGIPVVYVQGNHDSQVTDAAVQASALEGMRFVEASAQTKGRYKPFPESTAVVVEHGHAGCLFNGYYRRNDPPLPVGFFISRMAATFSREKGVSFPSPGDVLMHSKSELKRMLRLKAILFETVLDAVKRRVLTDAGSDVVEFAEPGQVRESWAEVRKRFHKLNSRVDPGNRILGEFDSFYSVGAGGQQIVVCGHSHHSKFAQLPGASFFFDTGAWCCDDETCFASVERNDDNTVTAWLSRWCDGAAKPEQKLGHPGTVAL